MSAPVRSRRRTVEVQIAHMPAAEGLALPTYESEHAAGLDLRAAIPEGEQVVLEPHARALLPTGLCIELPAGFEAQVRPRSGLALRSGVTVLNSPGTIDADYRGEIGIILINLGTEPFAISRGDRIAQLVIQEVSRAELVVVSSLTPSDRGAGGFGSTGRTG